MGQICKARELDRPALTLRSVAGQDPYEMIREALDTIVRQRVTEILAEMLPEAELSAVLDVPEAARRLKLSVGYTKRLIAAGTLRSVRNGRRRLVPVSAVEEYLNGLAS